jgi:ATP-dependent Clp protease ATP-binding subunit ClpA
MYERFTEGARRVVIVAQDEARGFGHAYIGSEHILLGLLQPLLPPSLASSVLSNLGLTTEFARARAEQIAGRGAGGEIRGRIPFTPRAKNILTVALREALSLGDNYIAEEHILLGLVREGKGIAAQILFDGGITAEGVRMGVIRLRSRPAPPAWGLTVPSTRVYEVETRGEARELYLIEATSPAEALRLFEEGGAVANLVEVTGAEVVGVTEGQKE